MIHAYLVGEGCARKWAKVDHGAEQSFAGWREGNPMQEEDDIDQLEI